MTTSDEIRPVRRPPDTSTGAVLTRRVKALDRTTLVLSYTPTDANSLRMLCQSIRLKGDKRPTLSVIARRALATYLDRLPGHWESEVAALNRMVTPTPKPAPIKKPVG